MTPSAPTVQFARPSIAVSPSSDGLKPSSKGRQRAGSIVKVETVETSQDEILDQSAYSNINVEWVNQKGAWIMHPLLVLCGKIVIDTIPGMTQEASWTCVNMLYNSLSYLMFHWFTGIPFHSGLHGGAYDELTLWEQIDEGAQYTPAKKWLFCVPIALFLASTHYTHYNPWLFAINITGLVLNLIPKLPMAHRQRLRFLTEETSGASGHATPTYSRSSSPSRKG